MRVDPDDDCHQLLLRGPIGMFVIALTLAACGTAATTSTRSGPKDIPISVSSEKSGLDAEVCRVSDGVATATGTFTSHLLTNTQPGVPNPYRIGLSVYDGNGDDIGEGRIAFNNGTVSTGHWQVSSSRLASGFAPSRCEILLTVQTEFGP